MSATVWARRDFVSAEVEDSLVLLNTDTLTYQALNPTAAAVWELLDTPKQEQELVAALCKKYDISEEKCAESVQRLMATLVERDMVKPADASLAS